MPKNEEKKKVNHKNNFKILKNNSRLKAGFAGIEYVHIPGCDGKQICILKKSCNLYSSLLK